MSVLKSMLMQPLIRKASATLLVFFLGFFSLHAQTIETFESRTVGSSSFTSGGINFSLTPSSNFKVATLPPGNFGYLSSANWVENTSASPASISGASNFTVKSLYLYPSSDGGSTNQTSSVSVTFTGRLGGVTQFTYTPPSADFTGASYTNTTNRGFTLINFATPGNDNTVIDELIIDINGAGNYFAVDNFTFSATASPSVSTSGTLSAFSSCLGTVSSSQSFNVSGSNLSANLVVTAPTAYEVSLSSGSGYGSSVSITPSSGTVSSTPIFVRLSASATGTPSGNVTAASSGATTQNVSVSGTVNALPTITLGSVSSVTTSATSFSLPYSATTGSPNQYSISTGTPTAMPSFSAVNNAALGTSPISVTIPASAANTYNFNLTVRNSSTGCVSSNNAFTVIVASASPTITASGSLSAVNTTYGSASASPTSFTVSGSNLTNNITIAPPSGYEVSTSIGSGYTTSLTLTQSGGTVSATTVYVRLRATATVAASPYTGNIVVSSTGATSQNVATVSSTVSARALTITANNANKTYGQALTNATGSTSFTSTGLQNSETIGSVSLAYGTGAAATAAVGTYTGSVTPSAATGGTFTASNYNITYSAGNIVVGQAALTITANNANKTYGQTLSNATGSTAFTSSGLQNSETIGSVSLAYGTGSAATAAVGTYTGSVTPSAATGGTFTASNYNITYSTGNIIVGQAALTITANNANKTYGQTLTNATGSTAFTSSGLQNSETIGSVSIAYGTGAAATAAVGTYTGSVTPSAATGGTFTASNYNITYSTGNIIVGQAALTITANNANKTYGQTLSNATGSTAFTSSGLQNSETIGSVSLAYGTGAAATAAVGTYTGSVTPSAATGGTFTASNYNITYSTGNIIVGQANLTITANDVTKSFGNTLIGGSGSTAFASTGLQNSETIGTVTITYGTGASSGAAVGTYTGSVTPSAATGGTFTASNYSITYTAGNIIVTSIPIITASGSLSAVNTTYGAPSATPTSFTISGTGLSANITVAPPSGYEVSTALGSGYANSLSLTQTGGAVASTTVYVRLAATTAVGSYSGNIVCSSTGATSQNVATVSSTVSARALIITANNANKTYGQALTNATGSTAFTSSGLQNSETIGSVSVAYGTGAAATAAVGTYTGSVTPSAATGGTFTVSNYNITYSAGNIVVGQAALTITANNANKTYGQTLTNATGSTAFTSSGLQNSETIGSVSVAYGTGAAATAAVGTYTGSVTPSAATGGTFTASNYNITYSAGNIIVGQAALTITANNANKTYGQALTNATGSTSFTSTGLQNSETIGSVSVAYGTGSEATAAVGTYTGSVTPSAATGGTFTVSNYNITYSTGNIIVGQAALTITANNANKTYGQTLTNATGSTAFTSSGLQNSETIGSVSLAYGTGAAATAAVGTYTVSVTPSAATGGTFTASNYNISYSTGNIIVGQAALTITANNANKTYGQTLSNATGSTAFTSSGLQNSETIGSVTIAYGTGAAATAAVGTYTGSVTPSVATGGTFTASNYNITYSAGNIVVGQATLTITATNTSKTYGAAANLTQYTTSGLVNSDAVSAVTLASTGSPATANVGTYPITAASATGTGLANYTITYTNGTLTVNTAALTITASNAAKTYGAVASLTQFTTSGLVNADAVSAVTLSSTGSAATAAVGTYPITAASATGTGLANYTITYTNGTLTVNPAALTITANDVTKAFGGTLSNTTGSSAFTATGLQNGETVGTVTISYGTGAASSAASGTYTGSVTPSALSGGTFTAGNYNINYVSGNIIVSSAPSIIVTGVLTAVNTTYGSASASPTSFTVSGGNLTNNIIVAPPSGYEVSTSIGSGYTSSLTITQSGGTVSATTVYVRLTATATVASSPYSGNIVVSSTGATSQNMATAASTVSAKALTITASNAAKTYGAVASLTQFTTSGLVNADAVSAVTLASTGSAATSAVGTYPITAASATGTGLANYTITYNNGTFTVNPAALTITASNAAKTYGAVASLTQYTTSGLVNADAVSVVTLASTGSAATATVGTYPITAASATGTGLTNYTITYTNGTLTVNPAALTITASNAAKTYGAVASLTQYTTSGLVNTDAVSAVTLASTGSAATAAVGTYPITAASATGTGLTNYTITYNNGTLTVNPAALTITASNAAKTYGAVASLTQFTTSGLVNADAVSAVTLASTGSPATAAVGTYPITAASATGTGLTNYTITYNNGTLTVNSAALTISANNANKFYGLTLNPSQYTVTGLLNSDAVSAVTLASTGSPATASVGGYPITAANATGTGLGNYTITYTNGTMTVLPISLTITAANQVKCQGDVLSLPANGYGVNGLVNNDAVSAVTLSSTGTGSGAAAGSYPIVASAATGTGLGNYTISYINGTLTVNALPVVTATASSAAVSKGRNVTLSATGTGSFAWSPAVGIVNPNNATTEARVTARTTYTVTLTAANSCRNTASVTVDAIEDFYVEPAVVFTPNGDGINDRFVIKNLDQYPQNKLQVFDRTGKVLYEYTNYSNNWDGTIGGKTLTKDTYFYVLTVRGQIVKRGSITVVR